MSIENPEKYFDTNVKGTLNIQYPEKNNIKKVVYAASASCYGMVKNFPTKTYKTTLQHPLNALTKNLGERLLEHWFKVYKLSTISRRLLMFMS